MLHYALVFLVVAIVAGGDVLKVVEN